VREAWPNVRAAAENSECSGIPSLGQNWLAGRSGYEIIRKFAPVELNVADAFRSRGYRLLPAPRTPTVRAQLDREAYVKARSVASLLPGVRARGRKQKVGASTSAFLKHICPNCCAPGSTNCSSLSFA